MSATTRTKPRGKGEPTHEPNERVPGRITVAAEIGSFTVPDGLNDLEAYRRWRSSDEFPTTGRIWWLCGELWIDMSREQVFSHVAVKTEITSVLQALAKKERLGRVFADGLLVSSFAADYAGNPDMTFVTADTLASDRIRLVEATDGGYTEVQGSPDMVLEVVSASSVQKDTVVLREAYWKADIPEYWLVDARQDEIAFDILTHTARGYVAARKKDGWVKSGVFGKSFRFRRFLDRTGHPDYSLDVR
jgi:hypothetical protein